MCQRFTLCSMQKQRWMYSRRSKIEALSSFPLSLTPTSPFLFFLRCQLYSICVKVRGEGNARLSLQITLFALSISSSDELSPKRTAACAIFFSLRNLHEGNASSIKFLSAFHSRSLLRHINEIRKTCEWKGNEENRYVSKQHFRKMDKYRQYCLNTQTAVIL